MLVDVAEPEAAEAELGPACCDPWLSFYELIPSRVYGVRLLETAHRMLAPGGLAYFQINYSDGSFATRPRR